MTLNITQRELDRTDLVVLVGHDGIVQWSSRNRTKKAIAKMLRAIARGIERGEM